jgi:endonuclease YncB( thermonuclease family)
LRQTEDNVVEFSRRRAKRATAQPSARPRQSFAAGLAFAVLVGFLAAGGALLSFDDTTVAAPRSSAAPSTETTIAGRARVIDGDTLEIDGRRIRLHGIDAPERGQSCRDGQGRDYRCGLSAARALSDKIGQQAVSCAARDVDRYGRIVAVCRAGGEDVNGWLVSEGWAVAYRRYSRDYVDAERAARSAQRGLWAGTFTAPEEWRHGLHGVAADTTRPGTCDIKGNISKTGERIYHVPGGAFYDATRIDLTRGERMFCSEAEARAAGWRRSAR